MDGHVIEIFSSFQGEGFAVRGSCYGKRQCFIRLAGCNLAMESNPCRWCDSVSAQNLEITEFRIEKTPGKGDFIYLPNPTRVEPIIDWIKKISTPDLHSISITGGEPLYQIDFLIDLAENLSKFKLYLETNGTLPENAKKIVDYFDFCCCDIKDETALNENNWKQIVECEFQTMKHFVSAGKQIFAKVVVTSSTREENVKLYARRLSEMNVPLAIQIVSSNDTKLIPNFMKICKLTEAAAEYLSPDQVGISIQAHKILNYL